MFRFSYSSLVKATFLVLSLVLSHLAYSQTSTAGREGWCLYKDSAIGWHYKQAEETWCRSQSQSSFYMLETHARNNWKSLTAGGSTPSIQDDSPSEGSESSPQNEAQARKPDRSRAGSFLQRYSKPLWDSTGSVLRIFGLSADDLDQVLTERATIIYGVLVLAILLIVFGFIRWVSFLRARGQDYGLKLFASFQFVLLLAGPILFVVFLFDCGGVYVETTDGRVCQQTAEEFSLVMQNAAWIYLGLIAVAFLINLVKSNLFFAMSFTLAQIILSWLILFVILLIWLWFKKRQESKRARLRT